jgi:predicted metal-binding membrane protein
MALSVIAFSARNERAIVVLSLAAVVAAGLFATFRLGDGVMIASMEGEISVTYAVLLFAMWWTMMMAMMLPSAAPAILTFAGVSRKLSASSGPALPLVAFVTGYAAIWTGFSLVAVGLQLLLAQTIALDMMMATASIWIGGGLLVAAGLYQMSPLKEACLHKCQAPLIYFARHWQNGPVGALRMGLSHGLYCVGCCWALMGLLFYGGVMEPRWIVGLASYVAVEKLIPAGNKLSRFTGLILIGWGVWNVWLAG